VVERPFLRLRDRFRRTAPAPASEPTSAPAQVSVGAGA
jgi:hypothetical protein